MADPTGDLIEALHAYIDNGGDTDTMLDMARQVAIERQDDMDALDEADADA